MAKQRMVNLLGDTATKPTMAMLEYMMNAEVGDDVFSLDPTVMALEQKMAKMFGMEAALFCTSGTQTNQIAIKIHTQVLDEMICEYDSHVFQYEVGGYAFLSGIAVNPIKGKYGKITSSDIQQAIKPEFDWLPKSKLVVLENSTNKGGGNYYTLSEIQSIVSICKANGLALHLDGARLFNVLVETGEKTTDVGKCFDSISICLSKGLGAPVGSVLIGTQEKIKMARRFRKVMGGGMRQAGYLAAAGIYALDHHISDLKLDNFRAKELGQKLEKCSWVELVLPVRTNIVIFEVRQDLSVHDWIEKLKKNNIAMLHFGGRYIRAVYHRDISEDDHDYVMKTFTKL